jgi:hypothetical protein
LKQYLQYARDVSEQKIKPFTLNDSTHNPDWYLKARIKEQDNFENAELQTGSLPFADLVVKKENQFYGLILTDDDLYYESISVKDSHALIPQLLEQKNWKHTMVYSRSYWLDQDKFFNEVAKFVTQ